MGKGEKNWRSDGRQFAYIMGDAHQTPLCLDLLQASQVESSKAHVVFHIPKGGFGLDAALFSQGDALLGKQVLSGLSAVFPEFEADLDRRLPLALVHCGLSGQVAQSAHS